MSEAVYDSLQLFVGDVSELVANVQDKIDNVRQALQEAYQSNPAEVPREKFLEDMEKLQQLSKRLNATSAHQDKVRMFIHEYAPLANELKDRYRDFFEDDRFKSLNEAVAYPFALNDLLMAQSVMIVAMNEKELKEQAGMLYTGLVRISQVIDKFIKYMPVKVKEHLRLISFNILNDPFYNPDRYASNDSAYHYMIGLKNTAKAVLRDIENYQQEAKYTVESLLDWVESSPGWTGDDFEECLDYINRVRKG